MRMESDGFGSEDLFVVVADTWHCFCRLPHRAPMNGMPRAIRAVLKSFQMLW